MTYKLIKIEDKISWNEALKDLNYSFYHTHEYSCSLVKSLYSNDNLFLFYAYECNYKLAIPIVLRNFNSFYDITTPYGFSGFIGNIDFSYFKNDWEKFINDYNIVASYIAVHPLNTFSQKNFLLEQEKTLFLINLKLEKDELYKNLIGKGKKSSVKKENPNISIIKNFSISNQFFKLFDESKKRIGETFPYSLNYESLSIILQSENVEIIGVKNEDAIIAINIFLISPLCVEFFLNVSSLSGRYYSNFLLWHSILHLKSKGYSFLNLGGGINDNDSLSDFKRRFGGNAIKFNSIKSIHNNQIYINLIEALDTKIISNYKFPLYRSI